VTIAIRLYILPGTCFLSGDAEIFSAIMGLP
jgi:hypothetical protein